MKNMFHFTAIVTAAIAMLSASALSSYNGMQQAFAEPCRSGGALPGSTCWCYRTTNDAGQLLVFCFTGNGACKKAQSSDPRATSSCERP